MIQIATFCNLENTQTNKQTNKQTKEQPILNGEKWVCFVDNLFIYLFFFLRNSSQSFFNPVSNEVQL